MPEPGSGEVRVRLRAIGVNFAEVLSRKGLYGWAPKRPYILGMEGAGEIEGLGPGVTGRRIGEAVIVGAQHGCYAQQVCVSAHQALPAMPDFTLDENAAFAVNYLTAWVSLMEMARLRPTDTVLVHAAAGGVGTAAVQLAKALGCTVYGTAGADGKLGLVKRLGADAAVNYRTTDFETEVRRLTNGQGVDVVLETVGGEVYRKSLRLLAPTGRLVVTGFASLNLQKWNPLSWWRTWRAIPRAKVGEMAERSVGVLATHLGYLLPERERLAGIWGELVWFVKRHHIRPVVGSAFPFERMADAHALMESRRSTGKIVVEVGG
ncbi:MAG: zinc-binding dehydrogenase [candidate division NC10 bacterium]|nr:zinc-binding dehydrogenase [candidate division NC10 bacterium]